MKTYDRAPEDVHALVSHIISQYHPDLKTSEASIDLLYVYADEDQIPLSCHGYPAQAVVRVTSSKERVAGRGDAEIVIDKENYQDLSDAQKNALIDHELYHLKVMKDRHGVIMVDDHRRPKIEMRKHDREYGWFDIIAQRHGEASLEVKQARDLIAGVGQLYFAFPPSTDPVPDLHV